MLAGLVSSVVSLFGLLLLPMVFLCMWAPVVSLCVQISSSYKDISQIELGPTLWPHFNLIISLKTVSKYSHILRYWVLRLQHMNGGVTIQPISVKY